MMDQKQYEDMRTIMQFGRLFADAMSRAMKHSGLLEKDYELTIEVKRTELSGMEEHNCIISEVQLKQNVLRNDKYQDSQMTDYKFEKEGWLVINDPVVKSGIVPPEVRTRETAARIYQTGKAEEKPAAPDGLWISRYDDPYPVDGGE